jgi:hypothetical protein
MPRRQRPLPKRSPVRPAEPPEGSRPPTDTRESGRSEWPVRAGRFDAAIGACAHQGHCGLERPSATHTSPGSPGSRPPRTDREAQTSTELQGAEAIPSPARREELHRDPGQRHQNCAPPIEPRVLGIGHRCRPDWQGGESNPRDNRPVPELGYRHQQEAAGTHLEPRGRDGGPLQAASEGVRYPRG